MKNLNEPEQDHPGLDWTGKELRDVTRTRQLVWIRLDWIRLDSLSLIQFRTGCLRRTVHSVYTISFLNLKEKRNILVNQEQ